MSRRYWLPIIAVVGLVLAAQVNAQSVSKDAGSKPSATQSNATPKADPPPVIPVAVQNDIRRIAGALETANEKKTPKDETDRSKRDLAAQEYMAAAIPYMFVLGVVEVLITLTGVILVLRSLKASWVAIKADRAASEDELRPYVSISGATFRWDNVGCRVLAAVQNTGHTPATFFHIKCSARAIARDAARNYTLPDDVSGLNWPALGGTCTDTVGLMAPRFRDEALLVQGSEGTMNFFVFGVLTYGDIFGAEYQTEFAFFTPTARWAVETKMSRPNDKLPSYVMTKRPYTQLVVRSWWQFWRPKAA